MKQRGNQPGNAEEETEESWEREMEHSHSKGQTPAVKLARFSIWKDSQRSAYSNVMCG